MLDYSIRKTIQLIQKFNSGRFADVMPYYGNLFTPIIKPGSEDVRTVDVYYSHNLPYNLVFTLFNGDVLRFASPIDNVLSWDQIDGYSYLWESYEYFYPIGKSWVSGRNENHHKTIERPIFTIDSLKEIQDKNRLDIEIQTTIVNALSVYKDNDRYAQELHDLYALYHFGFKCWNLSSSEFLAKVNPKT